MTPLQDLLRPFANFQKRQAIVGAIVVAAVVLLCAPLLMLAPSGRERAVRGVLGDIERAAETKDVQLMATSLHPQYRGFYQSRGTVLRRFDSARRVYRDADIKVRNINVDFVNDEALVRLEWTWSAVIQTELRTVQTAFFDETWVQASAVFRQDPADGEWKLYEADTRMPQFRARGAALRGG